MTNRWNGSFRLDGLDPAYAGPRPSAAGDNAVVFASSTSRVPSTHAAAYEEVRGRGRGSGAHRSGDGPRRGARTLRSPRPRPSLADSVDLADPAVPAAEAASGGAGGRARAAAEPRCDKKKIEAANKAAATAYKPLYYDNDFSYIDDPCYTGSLLGDRFKQMHWGDCWVVSVGGEYRMRYHSEHNMRGKPISGRDDDFLLQRTRLFANVKYGDGFRFYAEGIDAASDFEKLPPRNIEVNRADMLNLFADVRCSTAKRATSGFAAVARNCSTAINA